jgi:uncharacterized protein (DUF362 family)
MRTNRRVIEPIVAISKATSESTSIKEALDMLPIDDIIKPNDVVVITPNWVKNKKPNTGTVVGPHTLQTLIRYVKDKNPSKIYIAVGSGGGETPDVMKQVGYKEIIEEENIKFVDLNYGPYIDLELGHKIIKTTPINKLLYECDVLISFTQLKHHEEATMSASIKNIALGWPPSEIHGTPKKITGIHEDLHGFISSIASKIPIDLAIISCDKAMIGTGPSDGKSVNTEGLIIAGTDPVACDTIGARFLGFLPQAVAYLYKLYQDGVGEAKPENMTLKGLELSKAERLFSQAAYNANISLDKDGIKDIHGTKPEKQ